MLREHPVIHQMERDGYYGKAIGHCASCSGPIMKGESYYTDGFYKFHEECLRLKDEDE